MRQQLADLEREIYAQDQEDDGDLGDVLEDVANRVSGAADALTEIGAKIGAASDAAIKAHRNTAEGIAQIMGEVARLMDDSQSKVAKAVDGLDNSELLSAITTMKSEQAKTTATLATMLKATIALGERMASVEAAICAPKMIIKDKEGRPIGVKIGD